jgi:transposase
MDEFNNIELDASGQPTEAWLKHMYTVELLSIRKIADMVGCHPFAIHNLLKDYGIPRRAKSVPTIDKAPLEQLYVTEGLTVAEVAKRLDTNEGIVYYALSKHGIPVRNERYRKERPTKEWLLEQRESGRTWESIGKELGYGKATLHKLFVDYDIPRKQYVPVRKAFSKELLYELHIVQGLTAVRIAAQYGCHNSAVSRLIAKYELSLDRPLVNTPREIPLSKEELEQLYVEQELSRRQIGEQYQVSAATVQRWMKTYEIPARTGKRQGSNRTYERSAIPTTRFGNEFSATERHAILERDGYHCKMPRCTCADAWKLEIHHILPVEQGGGHDLKNGITLCKKCHTSIKNRELHYVELFRQILSEEQ